MKQMSIFSINSTLTKLRTYPNNSWCSRKLKMFSTIGTSASAFGIIDLAIASYCKLLQNKMSCVYKHTRQTNLPTNDTHTELQPIMNAMPEISDQLSPQLVQEMPKASDVDISKFEHYK